MVDSCSTLMYLEPGDAIYWEGIEDAPLFTLQPDSPLDSAYNLGEGRGIRRGRLAENIVQWGCIVKRGGRVIWPEANGPS